MNPVMPKQVQWHPTANILVIQPNFSGTSSQEMLTDEVVEKIFQNPSFEERMKSMIEASVADLLVQRYVNSQEEIDNPFDAIYLSSLAPDKLEEFSINVLELHSKIRDLSDSITFVDEWEN
jgi:hypothetical protein